MFVVIAILLFCGLAFHEIMSPICQFLTTYSMPVSIVLGIGVAVYAFYKGKEADSVGYGLGVFLACSQFFFFAFATVMAISVLVCKEEDRVLSLVIAVLVGTIFGAYGNFNLKMVRNALVEGVENPLYPWIVGVVGWAIIIIFSLL